MKNKCEKCNKRCSTGVQTSTGPVYFVDTLFRHMCKKCFKCEYICGECSTKMMYKKDITHCDICTRDNKIDKILKV